MAQERGPRARRLARRYGLVARVGAAAALVGLLACVTLVFLVGSGGVTLERADGSDAVGAGEGPVRHEASPVVETDEGAAATKLVVHVDGAVSRPGVYELPAPARGIDAIEAAGGLVEGADTSALNLAAELADGEKVHVPVEGEQPTPAADGAASEAAPVNLNTAGVEELDELPGVGEATARAIIEDREANGPFSAPEDLMRVSGIGEKKFERLAGLVCV